MKDRQQLSSRRFALAGVHFGAIMFGLAGVFGRLAQATPEAITFGRASFAVIAMSCLALYLTKYRKSLVWHALDRALALRIIITGILLLVHWVTFFNAVKIGGIAIATLGFASFPMFTTILECLLYRERFSLREICIIMLVSSGLYLIVPDFDLTADATLGLLWGIISGASFAAYAIYSRDYVGKIGSIQALIYQNLVVVLGLFPWTASELPKISAMSWLWIGLLGVFCTALAHGLFIASLKFVKARVAAVIFALEPVYAIIFAWLLFAERPTLIMLFGGLLILSATLVASMGRQD